MNAINDGGQAFPRGWAAPSGNVQDVEGMTLRDWFAGQCLAQMIGSITTLSGNTGKVASDELVNNLAPAAYKLADDMIAYREKSK